MSVREAISGERLTSDDHLFLVMEQVLGTPVIPQVVWDITVDGQHTCVDQVLNHLTEVGQRLRAGRLSRRVHRSIGPQRDRWEFTPAAGRVEVVREPLPQESVAAWLDRRWQASIDSVRGPAWEFSAIPTTAGHIVVSLVRSHVIADGAALIRAVTEAVHSAPLPSPRKHHWGDGVRDSLSLVSSGAAAALILLRERTSKTTPSESHARPLQVTGPVIVPTVAVRINAQRFAEAAGIVGGTSNTLFQAVTLGVLVRSGRVSEGDTVPISVPMTMRDAGFLPGSDSIAEDLRANATTGAVIAANVEKERYTDLSLLRAAAQHAYSTVNERTSPNSVSAMATVAQILPDAVVRHAAAASSTPLCLASNLGEPDPAFSTLGVLGTHCDLAMRSTIRGPSGQNLAQRRGGLSAWAVRSGDTLSLSFTSLDTGSVNSTKDLANLIQQELHQWGFIWGVDVLQWL